MPSGKQLSFQYGEVSPTLHFRSDAVSYAQGLGKLTNMYVRKSGGVSNRPGFEFVKVFESQNNIPFEGGPMGVKAFTYWSPVFSRWITAELYEESSYETQLQVIFSSAEVGVELFTTVVSTSDSGFIHKIRHTIFKEHILLTPGLTDDFFFDKLVNCALEYGMRSTRAWPLLPTGTTRPTGVSSPGILASLTGNCNYTAGPYLPVSYLFTAVLKDGQEVCIEQAKSANSSGTIGTMIIAYPTATLHNDFTLVVGLVENVAAINMYRSAGLSGYGKSLYSLVGRQPFVKSETVSIEGDITTTANKIINIADTSALSVGMILINSYPYLYTYTWPIGTSITAKTATTITLSASHSFPGGLLPITASPFEFSQNTVKFADFGGGDQSITPPIDESAIGYSVTEFIVPGTNPILCGVEASAYYQQRAILAIKQGTTDSLHAGDLLASKLGAPKQLKMPSIYSNTGAFQFSVPITDGTPVNALLAMERLIAFTERGVYIVRGGEQGVLTPTSVNPVSVSEEGCSKIIEPVLAGRKGYFVNSSHSKIMCIAFGNDANIDVFEATFFSEHIIAKDIAQMVSLSGGGGEETLYILRRDGKLVCATLNEDNSHGFSLIETDGYIESIYRGKALRPFVPNALNNADKYYDVLMAYVIRNGKRLVERLNVRDDVNREGEFYADCYGSFGYRLVSNGLTGYSKIALGATPEYAGNPYINIPNAGSWLAGANIPLTISESTETLPSNVLHFFYDDENGKTQTLRYMGNPATEILNLNVNASRAINVLTYTSKLNGSAGNAISIQYINNPSVSVAVSGYAVTVSLVSGVTTADQVKTAIEASVLASLFLSVALTGSGSTTQTTQAVQNLAGGVNYLHQIQGYFTLDVPEVLRNTTNNVGLTTLEKNRIQSRWLPAFNSLSGSELNGPKYAVFAPLTPWVSGRAYAVGDTVVEGGVDYVALVAHTSSIFSSNLSSGKWGPYSSQAAVSVFAEGEILSSPLNPNSPTLYLQKDGYGEASITLPDYYTYGYIGAPYTSEFETMDLETADSRTLTDSHKLINAVGVGLYQTRGGFYGMPGRPITEMEEIVSREDEDVSNATVPVNGYISVNIPAEWNRSGRLNVKQVDPAPMTILAVYPKGISGD